MSEGTRGARLLSRSFLLPLSPDSRREIAVFASAMTLVSSDTRGSERERLTTEAEAVEADAGSLVERSYQVTRDVTRVRLMLRGRSSGSGGEGDCFVLSIRVDGFSDQDLTWRHWTSTEGERETSESGSLSHARVHTRCSERERLRGGATHHLHRIRGCRLVIASCR